MILRIQVRIPQRGLLALAAPGNPPLAGAPSRTRPQPILQTALRALLPLTSLAVTYFAFATKPYAHVPDSSLCLNGGCRFDQMYAAVQSAGASPASVKALVVEDPGNPDEWCSYGELLREQGQVVDAKQAFDRAVALGPGMASVRMRATNFYFTHGYIESGLKQTAELLSSETGEFDEALFSYVSSALAGEAPLSQLLGTAIPAEPRPARAWLNWLLAQSEDQHTAAETQGLDARALEDQETETWDWMMTHRLVDQATAAHMVNVFWQRKEFALAQQLWLEWRKGEEPRAGEQLLFNAFFKQEPLPVPFDWALERVDSVEYARQDGLDVRFMGQANVSLASPRQSVAIIPGRYRFTAQISSEALTTNQGPYFQVIDAENWRRLNVRSQPILGSANLSAVNLDFTVGPATHAIVIELVRNPSDKFDNKISGSLHIYSTALSLATGF